MFYHVGFTFVELGPYNFKVGRLETIYSLVLLITVVQYYTYIGAFVVDQWLHKETIYRLVMVFTHIAPLSQFLTIQFSYDLWLMLMSYQYICYFILITYSTKFRSVPISEILNLLVSNLFNTCQIPDSHSKRFQLCILILCGSHLVLLC